MLASKVPHVFGWPFSKHAQPILASSCRRLRLTARNGGDSSVSRAHTNCGTAFSNFNHRKGAAFAINPNRAGGIVGNSAITAASGGLFGHRSRAGAGGQGWRSSGDAFGVSRSGIAVGRGGRCATDHLAECVASGRYSAAIVDIGGRRMSGGRLAASRWARFGDGGAGGQSSRGAGEDCEVDFHFLCWTDGFAMLDSLEKSYRPFILLFRCTCSAPSAVVQPFLGCAASCETWNEEERFKRVRRIPCCWRWKSR